MVGYYLDNNGDQHPFLYANGAYYDLTGTGEALAINGANQIVGWYDLAIAKMASSAIQLPMRRCS